MAIDTSYLAAVRAEHEESIRRRDALAAPPEPQVQQNRGAMGDALTALQVGAARVPGIVTGALDVPVAALTGRRLVSEGWDEIGKLTGFQPGQWADQKQREFSAQHQQFRQDAEQAQGFWNTAGHYLSNPLQSAIQGLESVPSMVAGGVLARGLGAAGSLGVAARAGIGEGTVMAGQAMQDMAADGVDARTSALYAAGIGAGGGVLGAVGGGLARRMGLADVDTLLAGGGRAVSEAAAPAGFRAGASALGRRVAGGALSEGVFEEMPQSAFETAMGNLAADRPWDQGIGEAAAAGGVIGGLMGGAANVVGPRRAQVEQPPVQPPAQPQAAPLAATDLFGGAPAPAAPAVAGMEDAQARLSDLRRVSAADPVERARLAPEIAAVENEIRQGSEAALRARYNELTRVARQSQDNPVLLAQLAPELKTLRDQMKQAGVSQDSVDPQRAATRAEKLRGELTKLAAQYDKAVDTDPDKIAPLATRMQAARTELAQLDAVVAAAQPDPAQGSLDFNPEDPVTAQLRQTAPKAFKGNGELTTNAQKWFDQYNAMSTSELDAAAEVLRGDTKTASWRAAMVDAIRAQRAPTQGADNGQAAVPAERQEPVRQTVQGELLQDAARRARQGQARSVQEVPAAVREEVIPTTPEGEQAVVQQILGSLTPREQEVLTRYHFDKATFQEIADDVKARGEKGVTRARIEQQHKKALSKILKAGEQYGLTEDRLRQYFPDESRRAQGGADVQTFSANELAQSGAGMTFRNESDNGAINQANNTADTVPSADPNQDGALDQFDEGFRAEPTVADAADTADLVEPTEIRTERDHLGRPITDEAMRIAGLEYDEDLMEGDRPFAELDRADQIRWTKAAIAYNDEELSAQQLARIFGEIADGAKAQAAPQRSAEEAPPARAVQEAVPRGDAAEANAAEQPLASVARAGGSTREAVMQALQELAPTKGRDKVIVVQSATELPNSSRMASTLQGGTQAFVMRGRAYFIADRIRAGAERAVVLHEIGAHLGMRNLLSPRTYQNLANQIERWIDGGGNLENQLARRALRRLDRADTPPNQSDDELIAYFIEEAVQAGVNPTELNMRSPLGRWFAQLWRAIKVALGRLGILDAQKLSAQDIVDLAFGAAKLELGRADRAQMGLRYSVSEAGNDEISTTRLAAAPQVKKTETATKAAFSAGVRNFLSGMAFTSDVVNAAETAGIPAAREFARQLRFKENRAAEIQIEVEKVLTAYADLPQAEHKAVNDAIYNMTVEQKWGFQPEWREDAVVDPATAAAFNTLSPAAQQVVKQVFRHGDNIFRKKLTLLQNTIGAEYQALIDKVTDEKERQQLTRSRDRELDQAGRALRELKGPYAPLRRFGDYVVVARSQRLRDAIEAGEDTSELMKNAAHYVVEFAPTAADATLRAQQLAQEFGTEGVWTGLREEAGSQMRELPFVAVQRLRELIKGNGEMTDKSRRTIDRMLVDLYISTLHETNARHSEMQRRNRAGATREMMRAFASQGRADSHLVSALEFSQPIIEQMTKIRTQAKEPGGDSMLKTKLRNELIQRHMMGLDYKETPIQDRLLAVNSFWTLLTSPAYYVQNATQIMLMTQPVMAARHGQAASTKALWDAARETAAVLGKSTWNEAANLSLFKGTDKEKALLAELQRRGTLDFGISAELGYWEQTGQFSKAFSKVMRATGMGTRKMEVLNRMSTALAAYRLELTRVEGTPEERHNKALEYADRVIVETHGDYSNQNAPRYLRMLPKVMTQFRKFQIIQLSLFARTIKDALRGANAAEKGIARRALGYLVLNHAVLAGALGVPAGATLAALYAATGGDDEPRDLEVDMRRALDNPVLADLLLNGVPAALGVNMSQRIGAGNMLKPLPFVEFEATRGGYEKAVTAAAGPLIGGLIPQAVDAIDRIRKGEVYQGTAQLMPRGLRDAMRGAYASQEGVKLRDGTQALSPDELSFFDATMMAAGMPTTTVTTRQTVQRKVKEYEDFYRARTTSVKRDYVEAYEEGDEAARQEAIQAWRELQDARVANGFDRQPLSQLLKAPAEKRRREQKLESGVRTSEQARTLARELL